MILLSSADWDSVATNIGTRSELLRPDTKHARSTRLTFFLRSACSHFTLDALIRPSGDRLSAQRVKFRRHLKGTLVKMHHVPCQYKWNRKIDSQ